MVEPTGLTLDQERSQSFVGIEGLGICNRRKPSLPKRSQVGPKIMGAQSQSDLKIFVAENALFGPKDGVSELWVEFLHSFDALFASSDKLDRNSFICIRRP